MLKCYQRRETYPLGMQIGDVICEPKEFLLKQITIQRKRGDGLPDFRSPRSVQLAVQLYEAVETARKAPVKVYTTDVFRPNRKCYIITTGSKDVHLELGRMGWEARYALVELIDHETSSSNELLLVFKEGDDTKGFICTKQALPDCSIRITLQVANG